MRGWTIRAAAAAAGIALVGCAGAPRDQTAAAAADSSGVSPVQAKLDQYTSVRLTADLSALRDKERRMIPLLIDAARAMDTAFWLQVYPARDSLLGSLTDPAMREFVLLNYGPWDRLDGDRAFVPGVGDRPPGAAFYPVTMS
ncbi:MAG: dipeptidyl-peptidase 3 family protein, partial [Gemmatimonadales bacterium]